MTSQECFISQELVQAVASLVVEALPSTKDALMLELQDDFRFLLISVECGMRLKPMEDERRELGKAIDRLMPARDGELTWMLNFTINGKVEDSYFGGDSNLPEIGF